MNVGGHVIQPKIAKFITHSLARNPVYWITTYIYQYYNFADIRLIT